jgi:two-component system, OmpR family, phosphate regulon response regulator PhoB
MARFLIVEHDEALSRFFRYNLEEKEPHKTVLDNDAEVGQRQGDPDIVVLDWTLPICGVEHRRRGRNGTKKKRFPVFMIAAVGEEAQRVRNLVQAALRQMHRAPTGTLLRVGDIELDRYTRRVFRAGRELHLSPTEFRLLEFLIANPGQVFSREQIRGAWGRDVCINDRTIDVHVGRLRNALRSERRLDPIRTVRGSGYSFKEERYFNSDRSGKT